jgi:hypothetical protein
VATRKALVKTASEKARKVASQAIVQQALAAHRSA